MLRLCLVLLCATFAEPCSHGSEIADFDNLANQLIAFDDDLFKVCDMTPKKTYTSFAARELLGTNGYKLEASLGFNGGTYTVKVKHRAVLVIAHMEQTQDCDLTFASIFELPKFVNTHAGAWTNQNGNFVVAFPYKHRFDQFTNGCDNYIDTTTVNVRRGFPNDRLFA